MGEMGTVATAQLRRLNLIAVIGIRVHKACARKWGISPTRLSSLIKRDAIANIPDRLARHIERTESLGQGWLDRDHGYPIEVPAEKLGVNQLTSVSAGRLVDHAKHAIPDSLLRKWEELNRVLSYLGELESKPGSKVADQIQRLRNEFDTEFMGAVLKDR